MLLKFLNFYLSQQAFMIITAIEVFYFSGKAFIRQPGFLMSFFGKTQGLSFSMTGKLISSIFTRYIFDITSILVRSIGSKKYRVNNG